ncbi:MAG TPA: thiamine phosphate synthase [Bacteroidia bacterium]|nr:thiamine phosphate synthase [Bacteroidia bacterium]
MEKEAEVVTSLFEHGLGLFHLRKLSMRTNEMKEYLEAIPAHFHERIVLHSHHTLSLQYNVGGIHLTRYHRRKKLVNWLQLRWIRLRRPAIHTSLTFHKLADVYRNNEKAEYAFLGTIYDKISGKFNSGYNRQSIEAAVKSSVIPLFARGGTSADNIALTHELGFAGMAFYSAIWKNQDPVKGYCDIAEKCRALNIPLE